MTTADLGFTARYHGRCTAGDDPIIPGELIRRAEGEPAGHPAFEHVACPPSPLDQDQGRPVCPACWCVHAGGCA